MLTHIHGLWTSKYSKPRIMCDNYWLDWKQPLLTDMLPPWIQKALLELKRVNTCLQKLIIVEKLLICHLWKKNNVYKNCFTVFKWKKMAGTMITKIQCTS